MFGLVVRRVCVGRVLKAHRGKRPRIGPTGRPSERSMRCRAQLLRSRATTPATVRPRFRCRADARARRSTPACQVAEGLGRDGRPQALRSPDQELARSGRESADDNCEREATNGRPTTRWSPGGRCPGRVVEIGGHRPIDKGEWLLHCHMHERWAQNGRMINVGVDATAFRPIGSADVAELIRLGPRTRDHHKRTDLTP